MKTRLTLLTCLMLVCLWRVQAVAPAEQLFLNENFQGWTAASAKSSETTIKAVTYYGDSIKYTLYNVAVMPTYTAKNTNGVTTVGAIQTQKVDPVSSYFIVSGFPNVTKATFTHSYTGGTRGCIISCKGDGDADWVVLLNANTTAASGQSNTFDINKTNVSLRFQGNLASQNAYLHDLIVYGMTSKVVPVLKSINYVNGDLIPHDGGAIVLMFSSNVVRAAGAITLGNDTIKEENITIADSVVTIHYDTIPTDASYVFTVPAGAFKDLNGTPTVAKISYSYKTLDTVDPTLSKMSIVEGASMPVNGFISLVMSEPCKAGSVQAMLGTKSITPAISSSNANLVYINYSGLDYDKDYTLTIPEGAVTDLTGNVSAATSVTFHTELQAKGDTLVMFTPSASNMPATSATVRVPVAVDSLTFTGVANAGARAAETFTYSFKASAMLLPTLPSVGGLDMYIQCGGGTAPQEYYIQKYNDKDSTWSTIETIMIGTNDRTWVHSAAAQSSVPVKLRFLGKESQFWFFTVGAYAFEKAVAVNDSLRPSVVASTPVAAATDAPINGIVKLLFSENVLAGTGEITLGDKALTPGILGKTVSLPYANLKYATSYTLTVPAGAFKDEFDSISVPFTLTFTTKAKPVVAPQLFDFVVSANGHGNGITIQSAFDAVPAGNTKPFTILVLPGVYNERPSLAETKTNVSLIGVDRDQVVITGDKHSGAEGYTTSTCQTVEILADDFYCENLTIKNMAGINAGQAVALKVYADKAVFKNVKLTGFQDTHLTANTGTDRQYYQNCEIHGSVDFIFGNGVVFFDQSLLYLEDRSGGDVIVAPSTAADNTFGYVFNNCTIDGASSQDGAYNLGRPWQNSPRAVYLNTKMNILPSTGAWISMGTIPALFAEYGSVNASNNPVDVSGRNKTFSYTDSNSGSTVTGSSPKAVLTVAEAAAYTRAAVLGGSDSWQAESKTETTAVPDSLNASGSNLVWAAVEGARCYGVRVDDTLFYMVTAPSLPLLKDNHRYDVVAFSEYGARSGAGSVNVNYIPDALDAVSQVIPSLKQTLVTDRIDLMHGESVRQLEVFGLNGQKLLSVPGKTSSVSVNGLSAGCYLVKMKLENGGTVCTKIIKH